MLRMNTRNSQIPAKKQENVGKQNQNSLDRFGVEWIFLPLVSSVGKKVSGLPPEWKGPETAMRGVLSTHNRGDADIIQDLREVMDIRQASQYLGVSPDTLYKYLSRGKIPAFKLGNRWRFKKTMLDRWMERQSQASEAMGHRRGSSV
jgi:excisionase family DNA binding protein